VPRRRSKHPEDEQFRITGRPVFPLRATMAEALTDAAEEILEVNWPLLQTKLGLDAPEIALLEAQKSGMTASKAAEHLGWGATRTKNVDARVKSKILRARDSLSGRRAEFAGFRSGSRASLNPVSMERLAGGETWSPRCLTTGNLAGFAAIMRKECPQVQSIDSKPSLEKKSLYRE
jgi:hypothetical protein